MKINENVKILGNKVLLVPYERKHVPRYHGWMQTEELQLLTASEPLTLEQEYDMQQSWRNDENKCTFIVLDQMKYDGTFEKELESMIGDVNLFFTDEDDMTTAEIEIMIAESSARGQGRGREALLSMIRYGMEELKLHAITAKIGFTNTPSITMFNKLGFIEVSRSDVFQEVTLELKLTSGFVKKLLEPGTTSYSLESYSVLSDPKGTG